MFHGISLMKTKLLTPVYLAFFHFWALNGISNADSNFPLEESHMVMVMVFNATFNNILVISWWSVLLMEETGVPEENHRPVTSH